MKTIILGSLIWSLSAYSEETKDVKKKKTRDYGDEQLLQRDVCRKPLEALETKYPDVTKDEIKKLRESCESGAPN